MEGGSNNFGFTLCSGWKKAGASRGKYRHVNGVLGSLIKEHYPGMVTLPGEGKVPEPACTWDHYKAYEDLGVANNIEFHNKAERVFAELWVIIKFPSHTAVAKLSRKLRFRFYFIFLNRMLADYNIAVAKLT